jgi:rhomboid-like protein
MNNASIIIWSTSTLGLRTCAPYQSLSPLCSKFKIFKESSGTGRQCTRRGLHSSSSWVEPRIHNSSTRLGSYGCLLQHGEDFSRASSRGTRPSFLPSNDLTAGVRWQSTKPNISGVSPPRRDIGKPTGQIPYLSRKKIAELFGPGVTVEASNNVIRKLQKQRESGTLDEGIIAPGFDDTLVQKALLWLRETYPIDEDAAILRRIEEEEKEAQTFKPQQNADPNNVYGKSAFDAIRERNIKAAEEKKAAKKKAEEETLAAKIKENPNAALVEPAGGRAVLDRRRDSAEWVKRYKEKAQIAMEFSPLTAREKFWRLLPPVMFCGVVIWFCVMLAQNYEPPIRKARLFPDMPPAAATVIALIVTNSFFFIVWRLPPMWRFMNTFFMMIAAKPRSFSLLGNVFSHQNPLHLLGNMCVLWFVGTRGKMSIPLCVLERD